MRNHYSYTTYADRATARAFDENRFGGPIGELLAASQATVLSRMAGAVRDRTVVDVGTGTGRAAMLFAKSGARVTGVDASQEMLSVARERALRERTAVAFVVGDAHTLTFPDRTFDIAVSLRTLMHTVHWRQCLIELCRVSQRLVIIDYPSVRSVALFQAIGRRVLQALGVRTEPYRVFSDRQIAQVFDRCGFRVRSVHRQFVLPIALHKTIGSRKFTSSSEVLLERLGLLRLFGSPVTLVAERCQSS